MSESESILINRVAESDLQTIALEEMIETQNIIAFDLKDYLFQGLILREKDFREALKVYQWSDLKDKSLAVYCSTDAIIPMWAYMLISSYATPFTSKVYFGDVQNLIEDSLLKKINERDWSFLKGKRVVVKGCSDVSIPASAYLTIANKLQPIVQSMMYGEPCSTVPIFKRPRIV